MGKIETDHTGSGGGITLSSDGTSLLLDGTAIGGGGGDPDLYRDNLDAGATTPSATGSNAVSIGSGSSSSGLLSIAFGYAATSTAQCSTAIGASSGLAGSRAIANGAVALGGSSASGVNSFAAAIASNSASYGAQNTSCIAMGSLAKAWDGTATIAIGQNNVASSGSSIMGGKNNITTKSGAFIGGGDSNKVTSDYGRAGGRYAWSHAVEGKDSWSSGRFSANGDSQAGTFVFRAATTNATAKEMTTNGNAAVYWNSLNVPNNSAFSFSGTIVARQKASEGTASAAWKVEGLIRREGSAGTTVLVNSATTVLDNTPAWGMALTANTTNGGLAITVTGAAATNVRFVATIMTSEVTYA